MRWVCTKFRASQRASGTFNLDEKWRERIRLFAGSERFRAAPALACRASTFIVDVLREFQSIYIHLTGQGIEIAARRFQPKFAPNRKSQSEAKSAAPELILKQPSDLLVNRSQRPLPDVFRPPANSRSLRQSARMIAATSPRPGRRLPDRRARRLRLRVCQRWRQPHAGQGRSRGGMPDRANGAARMIPARRRRGCLAQWRPAPSPVERECARPRQIL